MDTPFFTGTPHIRKRDVNAKYTTIHYDFPDSPLNTHVEIVPKQVLVQVVQCTHTRFEDISLGGIFVSLVVCREPQLL